MLFVQENQKGKKKRKLKQENRKEIKTRKTEKKLKQENQKGNWNTKKQKGN